ncbi:MAG: site-specific integrase, partial [Ruminococcus sp.]
DKEDIKMKASLPFKYITAVKNEKHQVVFDFKDDNGKRKRKWVSTGLSVKCSKKELKAKYESNSGLARTFDIQCHGKLLQSSRLQLQNHLS